MTFDRVKEVMIDTLSCDEDKITPEASIAEDLKIDSLDAVAGNGTGRRVRREDSGYRASEHEAGQRRCCLC